MNNSYVYGILEDAQNNLWCSTNGGLTRFDKSTFHFTNYMVKDGLQNNEFNTGAYHKGSSGRFYFGGVKGLNWFDPIEVDGNASSPVISITDFFVGDKRINDSIIRSEKKMVLQHFQNDLAIRFSVFDFSKPESNKVQYQLIDWDEKPITTYSQFIEYRNLLPGNYQLKYSGSNSTNRWSKEETLLIIIEAPFWQRWWFYSIVTAFII